MRGPWPVEHHTGPAADFHRRPLPDHLERAVWWFTVDAPALVLGSAQRDEVVDRDAASAAGVDIVRRRSGGGAVLMVPGELLWIDVVVPAEDPLWDDDVGRAFHWLGDAWAATLCDLGTDDVDVHRGGLQRTRWSDLVCFAGLGPGEVTVGGRKVLGMAQRRTRAGARFQCALLHRWTPGAMVSLLRLSAADRDQAAEQLATVATGALSGGSPVEILRSLVGHLPG